MTTFEHAMLAVNGVAATGLLRRYGWRITALAAFAAIVPDWDGITVLFDGQLFSRGHRVWGHNIFACCLAGVLLGTIDYRFDVAGRIASVMRNTAPGRMGGLTTGHCFEGDQRRWLVWILVAGAAALSQIPADAMVSGGRGLAEWPVQPLWPVSPWQCSWPMMSWGNPVVTIVFCLGMLLSAWNPGRIQHTACATLAGVLGCLCMCRWLGNG